MPGGDLSEFFSPSFATPGTLRNRKVGIEIRKSYFPKGKNKLFAAIFSIVIFSMILHFFKLPNSSKIQKPKKIKRHLTINEFDDYQEDKKMSKKNVEIIPENGGMNQYPNHRYADDKGFEEPVSSRFSKSFTFKKRHYPSNIRDVILRGTPSNQKAKGPNEMQIALGSSMRLKGIYKQSGFPGSHLDENYRYSKDINNLIQNDSGDELKGGGKRFMKNVLRGRGAPFQLPPKGEYDDVELPGSASRGQEKAKFRLNQKRRPITIYLDFFPMDVEMLGKKKTKYGSTVSSKSLFDKPVAGESVNIGKFLPPQRKQNGIILKLNLYPKESSASEREFRKLAGGSHLGYNEKAERKSFGWFFKNKKKENNHSKECLFTGLNPNGKYHITAKWKNEKGEWIHAEHVAVKYLKKENDSNK